MTRKRYVKLKMAEGLSRNEANRNAREIVAEGLSYQEEYDDDKTKWDNVDWEALTMAIHDMGPAIDRLAETLTKFANAFLAGIVAFNEAFTEAL